VSGFETAAAAPFRKNIRTPERSMMELVFFYTLDKKWMDRDQAKSFIRTAEQKGLLEKTPDGKFVLSASLADTEVPAGFRPDDSVFSLPADPVGELLEKIGKQTHIEQKQLAGEMQEITDRFDGHLYPEAAVILLAKKYRTEYSEYQDELQKRIRG
jgi:hypothetical protein